VTNLTEYEFKSAIKESEWFILYTNDLLDTAWIGYSKCNKAPLGFITSSQESIQKQRAAACRHGNTAFHWEGKEIDNVQSDTNMPTFKPHDACAAFRWAQVRGNQLLNEAKEDMKDMDGAVEE
jgi:hypothetical protein